MSPGTTVRVLTDEGSVRRGRRRWKPGISTGVVMKKVWQHDRCWLVRIMHNGAVHDVKLFNDEITTDLEVTTA